MSAPADEYKQSDVGSTENSTVVGVDTQQNDYTSRTGQKDHIPVQKDSDPVEDPIDASTADSDQQLQRDDADAIDQSNIINERTRGAAKSYREPGDEEGLPGPEDGTSRVAGGPN